MGDVGAGLSISYFFFSSRRRHTRFKCDWSSDVCSSDLARSAWRSWLPKRVRNARLTGLPRSENNPIAAGNATARCARSEERRGGEEWRSRWSPDHLKKKKDGIACVVTRVLAH